MKLMQLGEPGSERPVVCQGGRYYDLMPITPEIDGAFWSSGGPDRVRAALETNALFEIDVSGLRVAPPIARPSAIYCIGQNYAAHAAESGDEPPSEPILFHKSPNTIIGPRDDVLIPRGSAKTDWEAELGVVIGKRARYLETPEDARSCVAGYVVSNDVSERSFQLGRPGGQWSKGKSCETFNPLGPWLVTADDVPDPQVLELRSWVNGEARQASKTSDMIFTVDEIIWHLSQFLVLEPGDLVNTGTPEGVALSGRFEYLRSGDVVEIEITGLGRQRSVCGQA
ncbi:fumarylacetoacetate hydrolase family protein [Amycolatopsis tucumanensis]|uniref:Fumarylacetoacetate hydrolase family protein n=2 Tax=Pseudonocardiaceae TaxID=2070 RepID=A0ABP7I5L3_9PSEU|nr:MULTISPECIES: fumarylacetoacetate hydrolase family protein [Amycolatopsis]MCF6426186.1 fumarylacetoacetate hydrolase family protein [Amycolatopsis tucumanensis]